MAWLLIAWLVLPINAHSRNENRRRQANIRKLLDAEELYFFDASTHPLGDAILAPPQMIDRHPVMA
ncbi:MAG TPA: hypothetical protein VFW38_02935 [Solirubrobacteraceae bacterium]|nr:hypothetical protein [Solirubrobacteraceae bacterium]